MQISKLIPTKIKFPLLKIFIAGLWHGNLDFLISKIFAGAIVSQNKKEGNFKKNKTAVLAMERRIFGDDINALRQVPSDYQVWSYPYFVRKIATEVMWPGELREQTVFYSRLNRHSGFIKRLTDIFSRTLDEIKNKTGQEVKIVLTSAINFYQDYPWISVIQGRGGKFAVLNKESVICSPFDRQDIILHFRKNRFKYEGDAVFFYNSSARDAYLLADVIKPDQAYITGCPRVDSLLKLKEEIKKPGGFILLANFSDPSYFAPKLWQETIAAIYNDPELRKKTIVKCRDPKETEEIRKNFPEIETALGSMEEFFRKSPAVFAGFDSTACLDAMILGIPVIVPWWQEALKEDMPQVVLLGEHTKDLHLLAYDAPSLVKMLKDRLVGERAPDQRFGIGLAKQKEFLEKKYSKVDGKNSLRVLQALNEIIYG